MNRFLLASAALVVAFTSTAWSALAAPSQPRLSVANQMVGEQQLVGMYADRVEWMDEFIGDLLADEWTPLDGSDTEAIAAVVSAGISNGVVRLTSGDASPFTTALNGSELVGGRNWLTSLANFSAPERLIFQCRARINTAVTDCSASIGLTDTITLEEPFSISGTTITSTATDAVCFSYDTAATTDQWYALGVATDVDSTQNELTGVVPVADTYQVFRITLTPNGNARMYINNTLVTELENAVTETVLLAPVVFVNGTTTTSKVMDVDYIYVASQRE